MSRARAIFLREHVSRAQTSEATSSIFPDPAPLSAESQQVLQLAQDVLAAEGVSGEVTVNPWSGGYYVSLTSRGKERTIYLFSLKNERSNLEMLRQAARDLKSVASG